MTELDFFVSWDVIFKFNSVIWSLLVRKRLCSNHATNDSISSIHSQNSHINFFLVLRHSDICQFESKTSWEIFVQNCYFASSIISSKSFKKTCILIDFIWIIKFNKEIKIWFPFIVIHNRNIYFNFCFSFFKCDNLFNMSIIFRWLCRIFNCSISEC